MAALDEALAQPDPAPGRVRALVSAELERGTHELRNKRAGVADPVLVAIAAHEGGLVAAAPAPATLRADPHEVDERAWLLVAALAGALVTAGAHDLQAGELDGHLVLAGHANGGGPADAELAALAFDENSERIDRLRARALVLPAGTLDPAARDLKPPVGAAHRLRVAEALAARGANPADANDVAANVDAVLAELAPAGGATRPHDDPDPARRVARRILQRLAGMGKWGGYHTDFSHLARGFHGNDKQLAEQVGERLIEAGLLQEKPSVGQRHVYLNPRRAADVYALIDEGKLPPGLSLV
jgi:hypothetical protein